MAAIPTYQRQVSPVADMQTARASSAASGDDPIGRALQGLGQQGMALSNSLLQEEIKKKDEQEAVDVSNVLSQGDVYWQQKVTEATKAWTVGGPDLRETLGKEFDTWQQENTGKLNSPKAKLYFTQHTNAMKAKIQTGVYSYMDRAATAKLDADTEVGMQADENLVFNDPASFDTVFKRRMEPLIATSTDQAKTIKMADGFKRRLSLAAERGQLERDPAAWYRERFGDFKKPVAGTPPMPAPDEAGAAYTPDFSGLDVKQARRLEAVKLAPQHVQAIDAVSAGDATKAAFLRAAVTIENRGKAAPDDNAVSPVGATGAFQFMEATGKQYGLSPDDRRDFTKSAQAASKFYDDLYRMYNGNQLAMLAHYNGGTAAGKAVLAGREPPAQETREYVKMGQALGVGRVATPAPVRMASLDGGTVSDAGSGMPAVGGAPEVLPGAPSTFKGMDWEQQSALRSAAETRLKQDDARLKAEADRVLRDAIAMHKDGIVDPVELKPEFFTNTYGADGPRLHAEYVKSRDMGSDIGAFRTMSEAEIRAEIARDAPVPGAGYASADERQGVRVQAAQRILQAREADPVGYVTQTNESLKRQRARIDDPQTPADQRPAMVQNYVRESLAEQNRLGIQNPAILSPGQADAIAQRAMAAQRPEDSANLIAGLEAEYGTQYFPKVFGELVKAKKISGELLLIPNLPTQSAREAVSRMSRVKEADLTVGIDADGQKAVKEAVTAKLEEFARAVPMMTEQAVGVVNSYETSMRKLSYSMMAGGMKPADAVEQANAMLLGHYQFDGTMRVPTSVNMRDVKRGAAHMLSTDMVGIDVPRDLVGARRPEELAAEWQDTVSSRPLWFTSDDDSGLTLYAQGSNGVRYRVTRGGKPVTYTWPDLAGRVGKTSGRVSSGKVN